MFYAEGYRAYLPNKTYCYHRVCATGCRKASGYYVSDVVTNWIYRQFSGCMRRRCAGNLPMTRDDDEGAGYGYCVGVSVRGGFRSGCRRISASRYWRRERTGLPHDIGFPEDPSGGAAGLIEQVLEMALESGAVKLGRVSLDGTKVKANASKHKR